MHVTMRYINLAITVLVMLCSSFQLTKAFSFPISNIPTKIIQRYPSHRHCLGLDNGKIKYNLKSSPSVKLSALNNDGSGAADNSRANNDECDQRIFEENILDLYSDQEDIMKELEWRSAKVNLEEANARAFQKRLRSRPWKLPYDDARKWVQANLGVETKEEYYDLVANGNLRTPYIPKEPEKYYTVSGTWISWHHFLNVKYEQ